MPAGGRRLNKYKLSRPQLLGLKFLPSQVQSRQRQLSEREIQETVAAEP